MTTKLRSCEEMMALLAGLGAAGVASRFLDKPDVLAAAIGLVTALIMALATSSRLTITEREIVYSSLFTHDVIPLRELTTVSAGRAKGIVPARALGFATRRGGQTVYTVIRIGLFSWPGIGSWVNAANTAIKRAQQTPFHNHSQVA